MGGFALPPFWNPKYATGPQASHQLNPALGRGDWNRGSGHRGSSETAISSDQNLQPVRYQVTTTNKLFTPTYYISTFYMSTYYYVRSTTYCTTYRYVVLHTTYLCRCTWSNDWLIVTDFHWFSLERKDAGPVVRHIVYWQNNADTVTYRLKTHIFSPHFCLTPNMKFFYCIWLIQYFN